MKASGEFPQQKPDPENLYISDPTDDGALFDLVSSHQPEPEPIPPTSRFSAEERESAAYRDLIGHTDSFTMPDAQAQRAIVRIGAGNRAMRATVAREDAQAANRITFGLSGPFEPRTPAEEKAAEKDAKDRFDEAVERKARELEENGVPFAKAMVQARAIVKARHERRSRI